MEVTMLLVSFIQLPNNSKQLRILFIKPAAILGVARKV